MDYTDAETAGLADALDKGTPTLAQWARAEALKAILSDPVKRGELLSSQVNRLAALIVTGSMPRLPD